ncbi:MAG: glycine--tRNA ligase subunit beta [Alteromonadaceae bacterium]|nr:glycine--tRNA ligase subunit beta [Alteromonadaceae bacterium]
MLTNTLLVEIGTEELPPKALKNLGSSFAQHFAQAVSDADFTYREIKWYAAPRRLAVQLFDLTEQQPDKVVEKRGPALSVAFDTDGQPTKAALGWARGNGIDVSEAERLVTDKGEWLLHKAQVSGQPIAALIEDLVKHAVAKLPIPKPMRWGSSDVQFIRPVHTFTAMYGDKVLPATVLDITSDNTIQGHRFHGEPLFTLSHADAYQSECEAHYVYPDFAARCATIANGLDEQAASLGLRADYNQDLLEEIASLVEYPVVMQASFEARFLEVPKEALIYTMKDDQKYVPLLNEDGSLSNTFLFVSNIASSAPEHVIEGNQKVIRPRLADAEFFFNTDKKKSLADRLSELESILFQKQLGTMAEKVNRISQLAEFIASEIETNSVDAARAGLLSKTDLMSEMVMEFPDVQGVMGKYYALHDGESELVALAIEEQYLPRGAGDVIPSSDVSACVALADKLDTLAGIFGIGMLPKGDKDPFALRRAAIGVLRIITERNYALDIAVLLDKAIALYGDKLSHANALQDATDFVIARFRAIYQDQGFSTEVIQSVEARNVTKPADFAARVAAVAQFITLPEAASLASANKRVANILSKQSFAGGSIDPMLLEEEAEHALFLAIQAQQSKLNDSADYSELLASLATLKAPVDEFFDNVMVMADAENLRNNRLALLQALRELFLTTADISLLVQK